MSDIEEIEWLLGEASKRLDGITHQRGIGWAYSSSVIAKSKITDALSLLDEFELHYDASEASRDYMEREMEFYKKMYREKIVVTKVEEPVCAHCGNVIERRTMAIRHNLGWCHASCMGMVFDEALAKLQEPTALTSPEEMAISSESLTRQNEEPDISIDLDKLDDIYKAYGLPEEPEPPNEHHIKWHPPYKRELWGQLITVPGWWSTDYDNEEPEEEK